MHSVQKGFNLNLSILYLGIGPLKYILLILNPTKFVVFMLRLNHSHSKYNKFLKPEI